MQQHWLSEKQMVQLLGKTKLYLCLSNEMKDHYPEFLFTDFQEDQLTKGYAQHRFQSKEEKCESPNKPGSPYSTALVWIFLIALVWALSKAKFKKAGLTKHINRRSVFL
jgi:hypothetical protein